MGCYQSPPPAPPYAFPHVAPFDITNLIHPASNNALYARRGRLMVKLISQQEGNYARFGDDRGVYVGGNDILSNAGEANLLTINPTDGKITLTASALTAAGFGSGGGGTVGTVVSSASGNLITRGSDGGAFLNASTVWSAVQGQVQSAINAASLGGGASTVVSSASGNQISTGSDGGAYLSAATIWAAVQSYVNSAINTAVAGLSGTGGTVTPSTLISSDANNFLTLGSDGKLLVNLDAGEL